MVNGGSLRKDTPRNYSALAKRRERAKVIVAAKRGENQTSKAVKPPVQEVVPAPKKLPPTVNTGFSQNGLSPLAKRAMERKKSPSNSSVMENATHATAALTASTLRSSPEKSSTSLLQQYIGHTISEQPPIKSTPMREVPAATETTDRATLNHRTTTPEQALANSRKAADQAKSILNAVDPRSRYRSGSPNKQASGRQNPSPSRLAKQESMLASSPRRRQLMDSFFHKAGNNRSRQRKPTHASTPKTSIPKATAIPKPRAFVPSKQEQRQHSTTPAQPPKDTNVGTSTPSTRPTSKPLASQNRADSPLTARLEKIQVAEKRFTDGSTPGTRQASKDTDRSIPPRNSISDLVPPTARPSSSHRESRNAALPPKATVGLPPTPPRVKTTGETDYQVDPNAIQHAGMHKNSQIYNAASSHIIQNRASSHIQTRARSPSPNRRTTSSPGIERNTSRQMERPRPTPIETHRHETVNDTHDPPPHRSQQQSQTDSTDLYRSPYRPSAADSPDVSSRSGGRTSPGVERLSAFLLDSSSVADASTLVPTDELPDPLEPISQNNPYNEFPTAQPTSAPLGASPKYTPKARPGRHPEQALNSNHREHNFRDDAGVTAAIDEFDDQATKDPGKLQTIDSACLESGTTITVRAYHTPATVTVEPHSDGKFFLAKLAGHGLGRKDEIFRIQRVVDGEDSNGGVVRYGDSVWLFAAEAQGQALGTRKFVNSSRTASKMELGFFSGTRGMSEMWMVLSSRPDREILVGRAAVASKGNNSSHSHGASPAPVRSSDPVVLRNCQNGGILSVTNGELVLLTDSYEHHHSAEDPSSLGRLQNHDRLYPTPNDTFQLTLSSIPPCPPWVACRTMDERIFLTGSYLLQPRRNQRSAEFESQLFSGSSGATPLLEASQRYLPSDKNLTPKTKEKILIDEVLGSFLGLEGLHIRLKGSHGHTSKVDHFEFQLFDADGVTFDVSLRNLVEQILPLSTSYVRVRNFVSSRYPGYEYGRVMQAYCEALDGLLQDYVSFVSQLDSNLREYSKMDSLTMKSIFFQITSSLHSMSVLEHTTNTVREKKGGALINALWALDKRSYMGDTVAKRVLAILLEKASVPYMDIMSGWLQTGKLTDPYNEFMVKQSMSNGDQPDFDGDLWVRLFSLADEHVLRDVVNSQWTRDKIVTTGKYWNAVRQCHLDLGEFQVSSQGQKIPKLTFNSDSSAIASYIDSMYGNASRVLVRLMMDRFRLMESLQTMKRYFLIDQGDFLMHFLDASEQELLKHADDVSIGRLQHWLTTSVQLTEAHREEFDPVSGARINLSSCPLVPGGLRCRFADESLVAQLDSFHGGGIADHGPITPSRRVYGSSNKGHTGIEVFTIDFPSVPFPLSLVLSEKALGHYRTLFRHLFFTKHVERRLIGVWRDHQLLKRLDTLRGLLGHTYLLRHRMLHFVQNLIHYMVFEVIEFHWMEMRTAIDKAGEANASGEQQQTVDDILRLHNNFLERTMEACLLTNRGLIRSLTKLLKTTLLFTDQMKRFMDTTRIHDDSVNRAAEKRGTVQRNLNERRVSQGGVDKLALRQSLATTREERQTLNNRQTRRVKREVCGDSYKTMVRRFEEVFNQDLADFMTELNGHTASGVVANLGIRLDYNGYVSASMAQTSQGMRQ